MAPSKEGIDVVGRVHLVELPQHLRLVAPLEGHHRSLQFVRVSGKELHVAVLPLYRRALSWAGVILTGCDGAGTGSGGQFLEPPQAARALEPVLGPPLREDALFAWGLGLRARLASRARGPKQLGSWLRLSRRRRRRSLLHHGRFHILRHFKLINCS